jgi:DNA-directed RNA polymerase subunit omega
MKPELVEQASKVIPEVPILLNLVSRRVRQLNQGRPPLVEVRVKMGLADVALKEIIEGKIVLGDRAGSLEARAGSGGR